MKLLYFTRAYTSHDRRFLRSFQQYGIDVYYLTLIGKRLEANPLPEAINAVPWVGDSIPYASKTDHARRRKALCTLLANLAPDVVLAGPIHSCTRLVAECDFQPYVAMSWGSDLLVDAAQGRPGEAVARKILASAFGGFGDCQQVYATFRRLGRLPDERIVIFPWGIDIETFRPDAGLAPYRTWEGWGTDVQVVISLRSWEPIYAVDILVSAFALVHEAIPSARLLLVGEGSQRKKIQDLVEHCGLQDIVHMPGRLPNDRLPAWLSSADLYVSTALSDGSSISLLEAMGCGLPVIATRAYGNLEWIDDRVNGWLVPPSDPAILAETIVAALRSPDDRMQMSLANRQKILDRANWEENFPLLCRLLRKAASFSV